VNPKLFVLILILSGGLFNSNLEINEENQSTHEDSVLNHISGLFTDKYNVNLYLSACEKLMYENGMFYSYLDVSECKESVNKQYEQKMNEFVKPNFEYFTIKDTKYHAEYSENIYKIDIFGVYCQDTSLTDLLINPEKCNTEDIGSLYMAKNSISGEFGYAGNGFETTNGKYLEVVKP
jgi:hypothetical protein|tara:strand:+ start:944 stop:1477 length:534 start_codon:yes stop_codon:yes gene_type:complete